MATRLLLNYDPSDDAQTRGVERLVGAPEGTHRNAMLFEHLLGDLEVLGEDSHAESLVTEARSTPLGKVRRLFLEGFGRLSVDAACVIEGYEMDPTLGGTNDAVQVAAILTAQGARLEQVLAAWEHKLGLAWG